MNVGEFSELRYGLFIHYGLYSILGRGEWVMNRERITCEAMRELAGQFRADRFDADAICDLAVRGGMRYVVLTTMHHEGFRLYDTGLSNFKSTQTPCGRDLVKELTVAARRRGLKIGLYHSLNNWFDQPDGVAALECADAYRIFINNTFERLDELVRCYDLDVLWYDGWWPFDAEGWQSERMNAMLRAIKPGLLFNPRNGLAGDFTTPEGHISPPSPWRAWEACMTLNHNWGYHSGDNNWKSAVDVINLLLGVANGRGNLLLNIGLMPDGAIPPRAEEIVDQVGRWLAVNGEAVYPADLFTLDPYRRGLGHRKDFCHHGVFTASGNKLYLTLTSWPGSILILCGLQCQVESVSILGAEGMLHFEQEGERLIVSGLASHCPSVLPPVLCIVCNAPACLYGHGGLRTPAVPHPRYDPVKSDIAW